MTREELIKKLEHYRYCLKFQYGWYSKDDDEAFDMAIEALEQEPCADMVSRDSMWEVLQRLYGTEGELVEELMSLPPVLPMPKIGKWICKKEEDSYRCSLCTFPCHKDNLGAIPTKYCAGCGAYMQEVEND